MAKRGHPDIDRVTDEYESDIKLAAPLTDEQQRFVNVGYFRWAKIRNKWIQPAFNNSQQRPAQPLSTFSSTMHDDTTTTHHDESNSSNQQSQSQSSQSTNQAANRSQNQQQYSHQSQPQSLSQSQQQHQQQYHQQFGQQSQMDEDSDTDDASNVDLRDVMQCLKTYREFAQPIKLSTMVDIVQVLWDDEEMQQTY